MVFTIACALSGLVAGPSMAAERTVHFSLSDDEVRAAAVADPGSLGETIRTLSTIPSRVPGYGGTEAAAEYLLARFKEAGLSDIQALPFDVTSPVQEYAELLIHSSVSKEPIRLPLHALWPNLVRTCTTRPDGLTGPIIYGGHGALSELTGQPLEGAIVVLEFGSGRDWLHIPAFGGRAIVFIEPEEAGPAQISSKFLRTPINVPRFLLARSAWNQIADRITAAPTKDASGHAVPPCRATVRARVEWKSVEEKNLVGWVRGAELSLKDEVVILSAFYDSMSVAPSWAPGADQACGIAALLDMARFFAAHPPPRSVLFLATSGHGLFMQGVSAFLDAQMPALGVRPATFISLDLSSAGTQLGAFNVGHAYWDCQLSLRLSDLFAPLGNHLKDVAHRTALVTGIYSQEEYDREELAKNPIQGPFLETLTPDSLSRAGIQWGYVVPTGFVHEAETALLFGHLGYAFATCGMERPGVDSPLDTFERVDLENLAAQVRFLKPMLREILSSTNPTDGFIVRIEQIVDWQRQAHRAKVFPPSGTNAGVITGRVVEFVPKKNYIPDEPKTDALVVIRREYANTYLGVRCEPIQRVRPGERNGKPIEACFRFSNIGRGTTNSFTARPRQIEAYVLDPATGDIVYAKDLGRNGELAYPTTVYGQTTPQEVSRTVVVFPCYAVDIVDLFDPRYMQILSEITVLDARTDSTPESYGVASTEPAVVSGAEPGGNTYFDPCATLFIQRKKHRSRFFKALGAAGIFGQRLVLLNASAEAPTGKGYDAGQGLLPTVPLLAARDMHCLNAERIERLSRSGILSGANPEEEGGSFTTLVEDLHQRSGVHLARAGAALDRRDYAACLHESRSAWALASRAYPLTLRAGNDAVLGVLFYLALLLPSAYFLERLLFGYPDIKRQLLARAGIFGAVFMLLRFVCPAFSLMVNPYVVLLGFVMIALTLAVLRVILKMFQSELARLRAQVTGIHNVEIGRSEAAGVAFGLGISSMRKRKIRTANTLITLVILTFSVLSFTSLVSRNVLKGRELYDRALNRIRAPYDGVLFRTPLYEPLSTEAFGYILSEFSGGRGEASGNLIVPRAWYPGGVTPTDALTPVASTRGETVGVAAVLGLSPSEHLVSLTEPGWLTGAWFMPEDRHAAILPASLAERLELTPVDIGQPCLKIWGERFVLRGVLSDDYFSREKGFTDIDGEPMPPVDYAMSASTYQEERSTRLDIAAQKPPPAFGHFGAEQTLVLPFATVVERGGNIRSVAIVTDDPHAISEKTLRDNVLNKMATGLFAGIDGFSYWYASLGQADYQGLFSLSVLILIAGLIVFNTMLGSLYERQREIGIYTSLGLAPSHIGAFFLAESCVYAVLGCLFGYILGQVVASAKTELGLSLFQGIAVNYSSRSALYATLIVATVVMLSSLYPAWKAGRLSVPELERTIRLPVPTRDPISGRLTIAQEFPFTFTGEAHLGIAAFIFKFFKDQEELATGAFHTQKAAAHPAPPSAEHAGDATYLDVEADIWLAPFDWGVRQEVRFGVNPSGASPVLSLRLYRLNGEVRAWERVNRRFVASLRRQLLLWRTIAAEDRARYVRFGRRLFARDPGAVLEVPETRDEET